MTRSTRILAAAIHRNEIGRAVTLAGQHDHPAGLQRNVCNQRVSDNDGRNAGGQSEELCLIDIDGDDVTRWLGNSSYRPQQNSNRQQAESETRTHANTQGTERHTIPRGVTSRLKRYAAEPAPDSGKSDVNS